MNIVIHVIEWNEVLKAVYRMKFKAKGSMDKPMQTFAEEVQKLPNNLQSCLPMEDAVKKKLRNQSSGDYPVLPISLNDLKMEGKNTNTFFLLIYFLLFIIVFICITSLILIFINFFFSLAIYLSVPKKASFYESKFFEHISFCILLFFVSIIWPQ